MHLRASRVGGEGFGVLAEPRPAERRRLPSSCASFIDKAPQGALSIGATPRLADAEALSVRMLLKKISATNRIEDYSCLTLLTRRGSI